MPVRAGRQPIGDALQAAKQLGDEGLRVAHRQADLVRSYAAIEAASIRTSAEQESARALEAASGEAEQLRETTRQAIQTMLHAAHGRAEGKIATARMDAERMRDAARRESARRAEGYGSSSNRAGLRNSTMPKEAALAIGRSLDAASQTYFAVSRAATRMDDDVARRVAALLEPARSQIQAKVRSAADTTTADEVAAASGVPAPVIEEQRGDEGRPDPSKISAPHLTPMLSFRSELALRSLAVGGVVATLWFWTWWVQLGHGTWTAPVAVVTALLAWVFLLPLYFLFFVCRMTRPNPELPVPALRAAIVVTKAPSEPWPVLRQTLLAMLAQDFPHPYDVWLADEKPSEETLDWAAEHGVSLSTRYGIDDYHRPSWPRRTKCKEGNLAYFYDTVGYQNYDVVAQLDADHIPAPGYLAAIVRPFADARVGYVAAPSVCDANLDKGWTVRGRLYREATMHGPVQAGCNGGFAPVCIGSHYAVRTTALQEVGGIGPELAEDYSTTLWLLSAGWDGVFSIDAEAHGDGPESLEEMLTQELQWARSLCTILTRWAPARLGTVVRRARVRMGFALLFYPIQALVLALGSVLPTVGLVYGVTWGHTSLLAFYVHLWPTSLIGIGTAVLLRRRNLLRPVDSKLWAWEQVLFQLVRWPWMLWGFLQGVYAGLRAKEVAFKVTPKSATGAKTLSPVFLLPSVVLGIVPAAAVVLTAHPDRTPGLLVLSLFQSTLYLCSASIMVALHLAANRSQAKLKTVEAAPTSVEDAGAQRTTWRARARTGGSAAVMVWSLTILTTAGVVWRLIHLG